MAKKVVITAAITGAVHVPSMSPYLPITPQQIIDDAVKAYEAGAAVVHIHARDPETGKPSQDLALVGEIIRAIKARCDVVICLTTGGSVYMSLDERLASVPTYKPELASCNSGSFNFFFGPAAEKIKEVKYDWEIPFLLGTKELIFTNTFAGLEKYISTMNENGTRPEFEVYDVGMVNNIAYFLKKGLVKRPVYLQFMLGIMGGIPATVDNLVYLHKTARELIGDFNWSVGSAGKAQFPMAAAALAMGGNVRVGLEDNVYLKPRVLAKSSAEQVYAIKEIVNILGMENATPDEARVILQLKGKDNVQY
jgi:uncharacterized protein (DUF849 family)